MFSNADLKRLILPLVVEQALALTVGMADVMMVSYAGEAASRTKAPPKKTEELSLSIKSIFHDAGAAARQRT